MTQTAGVRHLHGELLSKCKRRQTDSPGQVEIILPDLARLFDKRLRDRGLKAIIRAGITASQLYACARRLSSSFHSFLSSLIIAMARRGQRAPAQMSTGNWMFQGDTKKAISVRPFFCDRSRTSESSNSALSCKSATARI